MRLKNKIVSSSIMMLSARLIVGVSGFISTIIVARLLSPEDFGIIAMAMTFVALFQLMSVLGLDSYLLSKSEVNQQDYHTVFTLNFFVYVGLAILLLSGRSFVSDFYQRPELDDIILILSANFGISALANITLIKYRRNVQFHIDFIMQVIPKLLSVTVTIYFAYSLRSYWALVYGMLTARFSSVFLSYIVCPYLPRFSLHNARKVINFSQWLVFSNVLVFINSKLIDVLIGRFYSPTLLGIFSMARELAELPSTQMIAPVNRVLHSVYAASNKCIRKLNEKVLKSQSVIALIALPSSVGIYFVSELIVIELLGTQWIAVIEPLRVLAISAVFYSLTTNVEYVFLALNKPKIQTQLTFIGILFLVIYVATFSYFFGILGMPWAIFSSMLTNYILSMRQMCSILKINYFTSVLPQLLLPLCATLLLSLYLNVVVPIFTSSIFVLVFYITSGIIIYLLALYFLTMLPCFKRNSLVDIPYYFNRCFNVLKKEKPPLC